MTSLPVYCSPENNAESQVLRGKIHPQKGRPGLKTTHRELYVSAIGDWSKECYARVTDDPYEEDLFLLQHSAASRQGSSLSDVQAHYSGSVDAGNRLDPCLRRPCSRFLPRFHLSPEHPLPKRSTSRPCARRTRSMHRRPPCRPLAPSRTRQRQLFASELVWYKMV